MANQFAAASVGFYGSSVDFAPNLDRLAKNGVRIDRCYTTHPTCAPIRAALPTGRNTFANGIVLNNLVLDGEIPTVAHVLRHQGFRTGGFGNFHQTPHNLDFPQDLDHLGFDKAVVREDDK